MQDQQVNRSVSSSLSNKEPYLATRPALKVFFFQFTGTILLTYGVVASDVPDCQTDFLIACSLFLAISWCGEFTGAHVNPAVSLGLWIASPFENLMSYIAAQFFGAFVGAQLAYAVTMNTISPIKSTNIGDALNYGLRDLLGTAMFATSIMIATSKSTTFTKKRLYVSMFIPIALFISREYAGGTGLNPAVTFAGQLVGGMFDGADLTYSWMLFTPLIGGALAGLFFRYVYEPMWVVYKHEARSKIN